MKQYELIREIFNQCSGNQMRDVFVSEIQTDDTDEYVKAFLVGSDVNFTKTITKEGAVIYDLTIDGMRQRLSFTCESS